MKKHNSTVIGVLSALIACVVAAGAFGLWYTIVADTTARGAELEAALKEREAAGGRSAAARRALTDLAVEEERIGAYFVSPAEIVPFLESLEGTGEAIGAEVDIVSVGDTPDATGRIPLSLSISGSFDAVLRTVGAIEHHPNDLRVTTLTLDTPQGAASQGVWTANITFSVGMRDLPAATTP